MSGIPPFLKNFRYVGALGWLSCVLVAGLLAPSSSITPDLLSTSKPPFQYPHWFGTDPQGVDVGLALWQGAQTVALVSLPATILAMSVGAIAGSIAGFWGNSRFKVAHAWLLSGVVLACSLFLLLPYILKSAVIIATLLLLGSLLTGWLASFTKWGKKSFALPLDAIISGLIALLDSIPLLILVLVVSAVHSPSPEGLVLLMALVSWTTPARLMRAATLQSREQAYIEAGRAVGLTDFQLLTKHVWPNTWRVLVVRFPLTMALLIGLETTLSFLGVGLPPETPSWGRLLAGIRLDTTAWWLLAWPGTALALTLLSLQILSGRR